jgi:3-dehydroquinate synthase
MPKISVELGTNSYSILIQRGLRNTLADEIKQLSRATRIAIITDSKVAGLYVEELKQQLIKAGFKVTAIVIPAGETNKNLATLSSVYEQLAKAGLTRQDLIITLGGGVVGDLGGFAAATFLRGIDFIQVPTTLLAQIDSSVGGKVAVDLPEGKNLVGNFYQPKGVFIDPDYLDSLSPRVLHDGMAEVIKTAAFGDKELFAELASFTDDAQLLSHIDKVIARCCQIKAKVVAEDEYDLGPRMMLNFGHTIGHAVEQHFGYSKYSHGEAVAIGMVRITGQTEQMGITRAGTTEQLSSLLKKYKLPTAVDLETDQILQVVAADKKRRGDSLTLVVLLSIGEGSLLKVPFSELKKYIG